MNVQAVALSTRAPEAFQRQGDAPKEVAKPRSTSAREPSQTAGQTASRVVAEETARTSKPAVDVRENERVENPLLDKLARSSRFELSFRVDEATKDVVVTVIDPETKDVIRQIPPEEVLRLAERLDSVRGSLVHSKV